MAHLPVADHRGRVDPSARRGKPAPPPRARSAVSTAACSIGSSARISRHRSRPCRPPRLGFGIGNLRKIVRTLSNTGATIRLRRSDGIGSSDSATNGNHASHDKMPCPAASAPSSAPDCPRSVSRPTATAQAHIGARAVPRARNAPTTNRRRTTVAISQPPLGDCALTQYNPRSAPGIIIARRIPPA